jgi:hypothetical protein
MFLQTLRVPVVGELAGRPRLAALGTSPSASSTLSKLCRTWASRGLRAPRARARAGRLAATARSAARGRLRARVTLESSLCEELPRLLGRPCLALASVLGV